MGGRWGEELEGGVEKVGRKRKYANESEERKERKRGREGEREGGGGGGEGGGREGKRFCGGERASESRRSVR